MAVRGAGWNAHEPFRVRTGCGRLALRLFLPHPAKWPYASERCSFCPHLPRSTVRQELARFRLAHQMPPGPAPLRRSSAGQRGAVGVITGEPSSGKPAMLTATGPVSLSSEQLPSVSAERAANKIAENRLTDCIPVTALAAV